MTPLWALPVVITIGGLTAVVAAAGRSTDEARRLTAALRRFSGVGALLSDLREAAGKLTRSRTTRVAAPPDH